MLLEEILEFSSGPNSTRIGSQYSQDILYTNIDLDNDLVQLKQDNISHSQPNNASYIIDEGDIVISIIKDKASVVSSYNKGKYITSAFIKCTYNKDTIDPWFICFYINESEAFKKEKYLRGGTSGLGYLHLTSEILKQANIDLPDIETQRQLGLLYKNSLRQIYLYELKNNLLKKNINRLISKKLNKEKK